MVFDPLTAYAAIALTIMGAAAIISFAISRICR